MLGQSSLFAGSLVLARGLTAPSGRVALWVALGVSACAEPGALAVLAVCAFGELAASTVCVFAPTASFGPQVSVEPWSSCAPSSVSVEWWISYELLVSV
jgi:hypothetical protein